MSNRVLYVLLILAVAFWYWRREPPTSEIDESPLEAAAEATPGPRPEPTPIAKAARTPAPKPAHAAGSVRVLEKPKLPPEPFAEAMESVHFKVEDGLAVAFGDVILGVPVSTEPITQGFNKPPPTKFWRTAEIPYIISPELRNPERVEQALAHLREKTSVNFVPFRGEKDAVVFEPGEANCKSYLGRVGGHQPVKLADTCGWVEILHEVMHVLGFIHEHSRTDRDRFVDVLWDNVQDEFKPQFAMVTDDLMGPLKDSEFDFRSVMLYPPGLFAKRTNEPTLRSKGQNPVDPSIAGLSDKDIERINKLFK